MAKPIILTVDDDPAVSQAITRDLRSRYAGRYRIIRATSAAEGLRSLEALAGRDLPVALIVSDHRMPGMTGIELLERSRAITPGAKRVLLTAYADTDVAIKAINDIGLDHYLLKPWSPPDERLFPMLDDLLDDWTRENDRRFDGVRVVGNKWSERSYDTRMFLARNHVYYQWLEIGRDPEAERLRDLFEAADTTTSPWCSSRTAPCSAGPARPRSRRRSASTRARRRPSTTSSSSGPGRPVSPPPSTAPRKGCGSP